MTTVKDSSEQSECGAQLRVGCVCRRIDAHDVHQCSYCDSEWRYTDGKPVGVTPPVHFAYGDYVARWKAETGG